MPSKPTRISFIVTPLWSRKIGAKTLVPLTPIAQIENIPSPRRIPRSPLDGARYHDGEDEPKKTP